MSRYRIQSLEIRDLWGYRNLQLSFHSDVTIIIGANGTGKTTILNLLRSILTADTRSLLSYDFSEAIVKLKAFSDASTKTIRVSPSDTGLSFQLSRKTFSLASSDPRGLTSRRYHGRHSRDEVERQQLADALAALVPFVWLPVSRRLPVPDEDQERLYHLHRYSHNLESVDERLRDLTQDLSAYRLRLESEVSRRYKEFERQVLEAILYTSDFDSIGAFRNEAPPSQEDQSELMRVFDEVGLLDAKMKKRIGAHFDRAEEAHQTLQAANEGINVDDLFVIPLIRRTRSLVTSARKLGAERDEIFLPLRKYVDIVNGFLRDKQVTVEDDGTIAVTYIGQAGQNRIAIDQLSSGEKQILILLTAALIQADAPVVYVADEPELSLHVLWQEKLLRSLVDLGGLIQVIVATHSPDIVGRFDDRVVEL